MKKALVLEGGALRGLFSAGVMDVMMEHGIIYDGVVGDAGGCGTGCYYSHYVKLNNSAPEFTFGDMQLFNFRTDDMDHEYSKGEELLTQQEGEDMLDSFGDLVEPEVKWFPWKH